MNGRLHNASLFPSPHTRSYILQVQPTSTDYNLATPVAVNHRHRRRTVAMVLAHRGTFSEEPIDIVDGQLSGGLGQLVDGWTR